jgi:hypothetical protein
MRGTRAPAGQTGAGEAPHKTRRQTAQKAAEDKIPEQTLQFVPDDCTYGGRFSPKRRRRNESSLFLKIVFDKQGDPAY